MRLQLPLSQAFKRRLAHLSLESFPDSLSVGEIDFRVAESEAASAAVSEAEKNLINEECLGDDLQNHLDITSNKEFELRTICHRLEQLKYHFAYLRKIDYRKIREIVDSLQIGSKVDFKCGDNIIEEAEKCGLDKRTFHLAKTALQYKIKNKRNDEYSFEKYICYEDANIAISKLAYREDRISSYILYQVTKKSDLSNILDKCSSQTDVCCQLNFQLQRDFAQKALKQRGWSDVDPLSDEYINLVESRFNTEVALFMQNYRKLSRMKKLLQN